MARKWIAGISVVATILIAVQVYSQNKVLCEGFLPENKLNIPVGSHGTGGITQDQFNQVMDRMQQIYGPDVQRLGATLQINRLWNDGTVNASATRSGSTWVLNMYGGLARHSATTFEGMALVACHEMGHHLGGAPKISGWFGWNDWASNEGEADYFATLKCLRRFFAQDDNKSIISTAKLDPTAQASCMQQFTNEQDQLICMRTSMAGQSVAYLFQSLGSEKTVPSYATPDPSVVRSTYDEHPETQCRMDTYFAGMNCQVDVNTKLDDEDYRAGACYAPNDAIGFRPACWFAAN